MPAFPLSSVQWMIPTGLAPRSESICSHPFFFLRGDPSPLYIVEMKHHLWPLAERGRTSKQGVPPPEQKCDFSLAVTFLCPQRMLRGLNRDRCSCSLRSPPIQAILWFYDSCFPKMCSLQFKLHRFTQALSLNSFFSFFFFPLQEGDEKKQLSHNCCQFLAGWRLNIRKSQQNVESVKGGERSQKKPWECLKQKCYYSLWASF